MSSSALCGFTLLQRFMQRKSREKLEGSFGIQYSSKPRRYAALHNWWLQDRKSSGPSYVLTYGSMQCLIIWLLCMCLLTLAPFIWSPCSEPSVQRSYGGVTEGRAVSTVYSPPFFVRQLFFSHWSCQKSLLSSIFTPLNTVSSDWMQSYAAQSCSFFANIYIYFFNSQ